MPRASRFVDTFAQIAKNGTTSDRLSSGSGSGSVVIVFVSLLLIPATCHARRQNWDSSSEIATSTQYKRVVLVAVVVIRLFCV